MFRRFPHYFSYGMLLFQSLMGCAFAYDIGTALFFSLFSFFLSFFPFSPFPPPHHFLIRHDRKVKKEKRKEKTNIFALKTSA